VVFDHNSYVKFTILIRKVEGDRFVGTVKEVPLLGQLQGRDSELLADQFRKEIQFLLTGRPDLERAGIEVIFG